MSEFGFRPGLLRGIKKLGIYPRYLLQRVQSRWGFLRYGAKYSHKIIFIAGLPKSGTTWLKKMLTSYPGFHEILIPKVTAYEFQNGGSHDYEMPNDIFARMNNLLAVTKMHIHGSAHNARVLNESNVKYGILYRDLRDVAVSYVFYVRKTPWHPEYQLYKDLSVVEGLELFADELLVPYKKWIQSWHKNRDRELSLEVKYENLNANTLEIMTEIADHFGLDSSEEMIERIVKRFSFENLSGGRSQGEENSDSFFRKGKSGDWKNHFTPELEEQYKKKIGGFLIEYGYEDSLSW